MLKTLFAALLLISSSVTAQTDSEQVKAIRERISTLRKVSDEKRGAVTRELALAIRKLPSPADRRRLAKGLANLSTEGDFGKNTLQEVADTLADAVRADPPAAEKDGRPAAEFMMLAQLARYENVKVSLDHPQYKAAIARWQEIDQKRETASFTLSDPNGKRWALSDLRGKVVLVNFWATWCPPCRKEMPDMEALFQRFKAKGFVVVAISDEDAGTVRKFHAEHPYTFPILLDPGRKAAEQYVVEGIPKSFIYNREGHLVAQAIDMRTQNQFLDLLAKAGLK